jgi:membrane fusion protein, copper/silver efflux system
MNIKRNLPVVLAALLLLLVGIYLGRASITSHNGISMEMEDSETSEKTDGKKVLYWYDPMFPQQRFDQPGPSPFMDMDLVPRYAEENGGGNSSTVRIDPAMVQNLGIRTAPVVTTKATSRLDVTGLVAFNDRALTRLQSPASAFVDKVWPLAEADTVTAGQPLLRLRVPVWTGAQHEWLAVLDKGDAELIAAGRERLLSLGMPASLIRDIEQQRRPQDTWTVTAPHTGIIRRLDARAGMTLMAAASMAEIQSINPVWVEIAVPERQLAQVSPGDVVEVTVHGATPALREGRVAEILPLLDPASRTVPVRVILSNDNGDLRPGMSARILIHGATAQQALAVPTEALLRTGKRTLVMVDEGEGRYRPQAVQPGAEIGEQTLILDGLQQGQRVVVSGQFLLDSEASLQGIGVQELAESNVHNMTEALHYAEGVVEQLGDSKVKLKHGPFETLGMPGMTMRFRLANERVASGIAEGDGVRIGVSDTDAGLIVESLEKQEIRP